MRERERERERERTFGVLPPGVLAGATTRQDVVKLVITINRSSRPSTCSSRRDEAVSADLAAIGAPMSPDAPPQVSSSERVESTRRRRKSPPPSSSTVLRHSSVTAGNRLRRRRRRISRFGLLYAGLYGGAANFSRPWAASVHLARTIVCCLGTLGETNKYVIFGRIWCYWTFHSNFYLGLGLFLFGDGYRNCCMPDCMEVQPTLVDRLSCSLVCVDKSSTGGVRALSRAVLCFCAMSGSMDFGVASHTSLGDSPVAHPSLFPFSGYCWWSVVLSVRETGVTLLYDDASGVTRCPLDRR
ncbi:hypothetical protein F2Q68_00036198 [Brassica cretica]|uniref:Uncharacterized protein n=1 Tax=Brassica cretica TaxID=69181 RepID=A0A8S9H0Y2_BRACR|nr:hypothetical protein F2Q68_00036198 [Brassica cretica]